MVTLEPDRPHPIISVRPGAGKRSATAPDVGPPEGRHRAGSGWTPYQPSHMDVEGSGLARFLPSWGHGSVWTVPTADLQAQAEQPAQFQSSASEPPDATRPERESRIEVDQPADQGAGPLERRRASLDGRRTAKRATESPGQASSHRRTPASGRMPVLRADPAGSVFRRPARSVRAVTEVSETDLLPAAEVAAGSPLASLLGFGEVETSFDSHRAVRGQPGRSALRDDEYWDRLPSLTSVTSKLDGSRNVGDAVKAMWDATSEWDMESKLMPDDLPGIETKDRRGLWRVLGILAGLAVLATLVGASYKVLTDMPVQAAAAREARYTQSAQQLFDTLGPVANSVYFDALSSDAGMSTLTSHLSDLDIAARQSASLAAEPLPSTPILGRTADINALAEPRDLLASSSGQALDIGKRIGDAMAYSLTMSLAFNLPELPEQAPSSRVDEIALHLSTSIAETSLLLTRLPDDPAFEGFRQRASETVASVEQIQAEYIAALRSGDAVRAADIRSRLDGAIAGLRQDLQAPIGEIKIWAVSRLDQVAAIVGQV